MGLFLNEYSNEYIRVLRNQYRCLLEVYDFKKCRHLIKQKGVELSIFMLGFFCSFKICQSMFPKFPVPESFVKLTENADSWVTPQTDHT